MAHEIVVVIWTEVHDHAAAGCPEIVGRRWRHAGRAGVLGQGRGCRLACPGCLTDAMLAVAD